MKSYTNWLDHGDHREIVKRAYANACRVLVGMHKIAKSLNPGIRPLGEAIVAVGSASAGLAVDEKPRLVIDDRTADPSFRNNNHLQKLLDLGRFAQDYQPSLKPEIYDSLLDLADKTTGELSALMPRDRIDVQSFICVVGDYREGRDTPTP